MMEERYHATTQNGFYPDMSNVNINITEEAKIISPLTYNCRFTFKRRATIPKVLTDGWTQNSAESCEEGRYFVPVH